MTMYDHDDKCGLCDQNCENPVNCPSYAQVVIRNYYEARGLKWPTAEQAMLWAMTEMGEATDELLDREPGWKRNDPSKEVPFDADRFAEELGDTIMMLMVAGMQCDRDPMHLLFRKMMDKMVGGQDENG